MKLPDKIFGKNKIRDLQILKLFLADNLTLKEIGSKVNLTASRVQQIVYVNRALIAWDKDYEKAVRVNAIKRLYNKHDDTMGKKSTLDILEQLRKEMEGDKPLIDQSRHTHKTVVYLDSKAVKEENEENAGNLRRDIKV